MHTATTENVSWCTPMKKLTAFLELEAATAGQNPAKAGATAECYSSLQS
jgi:hypothetical protein